MQITSATNTIFTTRTQRSGNDLSPDKADVPQKNHDKSFLRELASSLDPKNMSRQESLDLANALMRSGQGDLSTAFLPPPLLQVQSDGSVKNLSGTPEGDQVMSEKFNMFDSLKDRIEYKKLNNQPTEILDNALFFLEQIQIAKTTRSINEFA